MSWMSSLASFISAIRLDISGESHASMCGALPVSARIFSATSGAVWCACQSIIVAMGFPPFAESNSAYCAPEGESRTSSAAPAANRSRTAAARLGVSLRRGRRTVLFRRAELGFTFKPAYQVFVGRMGNHPVELRAVVVHQAHVFGDHVVHFPFVADQMDLVADRVFRSLGCYDLAADVGEAAVDALVDVEDLFVGVGLDDIGVGAFEHVGKKLDELILLLGRAAPPVGAQSASGHFGEIEAREENLPELSAPVLELRRRFQLRIAQNRKRLVEGGFDLIGGQAGASLAAEQRQDQKQKSGCSSELFISAHHLFSRYPSKSNRRRQSCRSDPEYPAATRFPGSCRRVE